MVSELGFPLVLPLAGSKSTGRLLAEFSLTPSGRLVHRWAPGTGAGERSQVFVDGGVIQVGVPGINHRLPQSSIGFQARQFELEFGGELLGELDIFELT